MKTPSFLRSLALLTAFGGAALSAAAQAPAAPLTLAIAGQPARTLSAAELAKLPREKVSTKDFEGKPHTYEGIALHHLLTNASVRMDCRGDAIAQVVVVRSQDGYRTVLAIAEVSPELTNHTVLLADARDGQPLAAKSGPWQLVVPGDRKPTRWVRQVQQISVGMQAVDRPE